MKVGDLVIVLPYEVKLRARWNNETRSEDYIGQCGTVAEIMEELCGQPLTTPQVYVEFGDGFVGSYSPDKLEKYNPLSIDEDYYITPRKDKPLTADEIVSVQPMPAPSGFVFYYEENEE